MNNKNDARVASGTMRLARAAGLAAGCALAAMAMTGSASAAMSEDACQKLTPEEFAQAVDDGQCLLEAQPAAGPQLADKRGTHNGDHDGRPTGGRPARTVEGPVDGGDEGDGDTCHHE